MKLTEFYNEVSRRADTDGTKISAAETRRVLSEAFGLLSELGQHDCLGILYKGVALARIKTLKKTEN